MTTESAAPTFIPVPPPGTNWIAAIQPSLALTMIGTVFTSILASLLLALFAFSSRTLRRRPVFALNILSILLGMTAGIINAYVEVTHVLTDLLRNIK